jgi:D-3-phosphoglycerate dehydrogenase
VNLPAIALPQQPGMSRIVHVHVNTPGVLAQVNSILADHQVNVEGQLLSTRGEYGYLITDISGDYSDEVLDQLRAMEQTLRLRVLS